TAYFFARRLHQQLGVPVGIVHCSVGGSSIEAWMSDTSLQSFHEFDAIRERVRQAPSAEALEAQNAAEQDEWHRQALAADPGYQGTTPIWADPAAPLTGWKPIDLPTADPAAACPENATATLWFRHTFELPAGWTDYDTRLE